MIFYTSVFTSGAQNQIVLIYYLVLARRRRKFGTFRGHKLISLLFLKHFESIFDPNLVHRLDFPRFHTSVDIIPKKRC